jgi:very-short-patch-repair endonuclease
MPQKDSDRIRGISPTIVNAARSLRLNLTPAETALWNAIRGKTLLGLRFRCQHPVGRFIVDFYCPSHRLVIEVDGEIHLHQQEYDANRTEQLQTFGYHVLRFSNEEVLLNLPNVLHRITETIALLNTDSQSSQ